MGTARTPLLQNVRNLTRQLHYSIHTIQELLGHADVSTTMIYTHVASTGATGFRSPLDQI